MNKRWLILIMTSVMALGGCDSSIDQQTRESLRPCTGMGFGFNQCLAAYRYAGSPVNDYQWLGMVPAFQAAANANSAQAYTYHPEYMNDPTYYQRNFGNNPNRAWFTPDMHTLPPAYQPTYQQPSAPVAAAPATRETPERNTNTFIPGQKVQPLFKPNVIGENKAAPKAQSPAVTAPAQPFKPIMVQPPKASSSPKPNFRPIQVAPSTAPAANDARFKPIAVVPPATKQAPVVTPSANKFRPIQVAPTPKPASKPAPAKTFKPVTVAKPKTAAKR